MCNVTPSSAPFKAMGQLSQASQAGPSSPAVKPYAPTNPMGVAMAGKAASAAGADMFAVKPMKIADSFLGTTSTQSQKPESGYRVVG